MNIFNKGKHQNRSGGFYDQKEWLWVILVSILILIIISSPILVGYLSQTKTERFSGTIYDRPDVSVHLAMMRYGMRGKWDYKFRFTSEQQKGYFIKEAYLAMGNLLRPFTSVLNNDLAIPYHIYRLAFGFIVCLVTYLLMKLVFVELFYRRLGFLFILIGGGIGWLQWIFNWQPNPLISPIEFWFVDGYVFFGMLVFPHFLIVLSLSIGMLSAYLSYLKSFYYWKIILIAVFGVAIQAIQPYAVILADLALVGALFGYIFNNRKGIIKQIFTLVGIGFSQLPLLLYTLWAIRSDPNLITFSNQNITPTPPPIYLFFGYFFFWPLAIIGIIQFIKKPRVQSGAAVFWLIGALTLAYNPWILQRRFLLGLTIPLSMLAIDGLEVAITYIKTRFQSESIHKWKLRFSIILIALMGYSAAFRILAYTRDITRQPSVLYDSSDLINAMDWLAVNTPQDAIILSEIDIGMIIPTRTDLISYIGSPFETLNYKDKEVQVAHYFAGEMAPGWLEEQGIQWVLYKSDELNQHGLQSAYSNESYTIYQVLSP